MATEKWWKQYDRKYRSVYDDQSEILFAKAVVVWSDKCLQIMDIMDVKKEQWIHLLIFASFTIEFILGSNFVLVVIFFCSSQIYRIQERTDMMKAIAMNRAAEFKAIGGKLEANKWAWSSQVSVFPICRKQHGYCKFHVYITYILSRYMDQLQDVWQVLTTVPNRAQRWNRYMLGYTSMYAHAH